MKNYICWLLALLIPSILTSCGSGDGLLSMPGVCDGYPDSATSAYRLPWQTGASFEVGQGNCGGITHNGSVKYSYDFNMPIGTNITAARAGTVYKVVEDKADGNGCNSGDNHIYIEHSDGTVSMYLHLTQNGSNVQVGDSVTQGQSIGTSGNSGCSGGPHLHFQVNSSRNSKKSIPVTFSNAGVNKRGLQAGKTYTAN